MLAVLRDIDRVPGTVITGTPIQRASQVVVPPLYGIVSSATSTALNERRYSATPTRGEVTIRPASIPARSKSRISPSRVGPCGTPAKTIRESGSRVRISAHSLRTIGESFKTLLNDPNVMKPLRLNGGASAHSIETRGR